MQCVNCYCSGTFSKNITARSWFAGADALVLFPTGGVVAVGDTARAVGVVVNIGPGSVARMRLAMSFM